MPKLGESAWFDGAPYFVLVVVMVSIALTGDGMQDAVMMRCGLYACP